ncbi:hypothetical protein [Bosea lathyri]|uniref:Uncharacterized protein n=1 Tax=Bosea lathyri TaxID=1036778 RepID=A0A1H5ZG99_9HYPH|nr:hypothetical protein [Bosea lathyri]SEG34775.1 hypothetical protein SAMN04488115_104400 [Bosea lathyri]
MTTKKQIKWLLQQLADRNGDLSVVGPFVVVKPLRHVIRTISVDRTSSADYPQFFWSIGHSFNPFTSLQGICLEQFYLERGAPSQWSQPGMADAFIEAAEQRILPMLRKVVNIADILRVEGERSHEFNSTLQYAPYQMHFHAANGQLGEAVAVLNAIKSGHWSRTTGRRRDFEYATDRLGPLLLAEDRDGIAALLHRWERDFVEWGGLEAIYESTPFPIELQPPA